MSHIEESVILKMRERAALGLTKYGVSLADAPLTRLQLLRHAQEEAMDLAAYLETLIQKEEKLLHQANEAREEPTISCNFCRSPIPIRNPSLFGLRIENARKPKSHDSSSLPYLGVK